MIQTKQIFSFSNYYLNSLVVFVISLAIGIRDLRVIPYDDAAITYRYAWNISHGIGWVYNIGDRTNGASSPLYTLLLSMGSRFGISLPGFSEAVDVVAYSLISLLVFNIIGELLYQQFGNQPFQIIYPLFGVTIFILSEGARSILLSGMESAFCSALGLMAIYAAIRRKFNLAWFVMGLALVAKLDAIALIPTLMLLQIQIRRPSKRQILRYFLYCLIASVPWFVFSFFYFGSIIPHSAMEKILGTLRPGYQLNNLWIIKHMTSDGYLFPLIAIAFLSFLLISKSKRKSLLVSALSILLWALIHGSFFSLVNLGDQYDWYLGVLYAPIVISMSIMLCFVYKEGLANLHWLLKTLAGFIVTSSVLIGPNFTSTVVMLKNRHQISSYEGFERTRQLAGEWLGAHTIPSDVILTCFGWVAWGAKSNLIFESCPLSTSKPVGSPKWFVDSSFPGDHVPTTSPLGTIVKSYRSDIGQGGATWIVKIEQRA